MNREPGPVVGVAGFVASLSLAEVNTLVALCVGLCTLGFVITRWAHFVASRGGFRSLFSVRQSSPVPVVQRCVDCPAEMRERRERDPLD